MTEIKPCPVCGWDDGHPGIREGETYRHRIIACNSCDWGVEVRVHYADDHESIVEKCISEWNDRRTWKERQND